MSERPNTAKVLAGLKDFQRATVDYVCERLYGPNPTRRFLVADEVGLGKTLVARGVVARTIDYLWDKVDRIDVIYICSNADIARQNMQRLSIPGCEITAQSTRLTLLPLHLQTLKKKGVNFIALTPATSFEQNGGGGRMDERVLLYWLLDRAWDIDGSRSSLYVLQNHAGVEKFERAVGNFNLGAINESLAEAFVIKLKEVVELELAEGRPDLKSRFDELRSVFCRVDAKVDKYTFSRRSEWLGELRRLLAKVCLKALEPDLVILDEFQRFKHLLEDESEAGELARHLFNSEAGIGARVLLLSATPYKGLSLHHEKEDDHYGDFLALLEFLEDGKAEGLKEIIAEYRDALPAVSRPEGLNRLRNAKQALQNRLKKVVARTERLSQVKGCPSMLEEIPPYSDSLHVSDLRAFLGAQKIADVMNQGDVIEYWKSAPYLFNFMESYALKNAFKEQAADREMVLLVRKNTETFLDLNKIRNYKEIDPANPRLRTLIQDTVGRGMWRLLWIPPAIPYYLPAGPFAAPRAANITKRLVFSAWHMVPRAVAALVSYEAERNMMRAPEPLSPVTQEDWKKQAGLLRFGMASEKPANMPLMLFVYPCVVFARDFDPRNFAEGELLAAEEMQGKFSARLRELVQNLQIVAESGGNADERWYWLAPMLLDHIQFPKVSLVWWQRAGLAQLWAGSAYSEAEVGWLKHVELAFQTLSGVMAGEIRLGPMPGDLFHVLAVAASASPATVALRTYARVSRSSDVASNNIRDIAAQTGRAFLSLFNHAEVIEMVRAEFRGEPYWKHVLEYAHSGGIQAVLDEYAHLLRESLGLAEESAGSMVAKIAAEVIGTVALRAASLQVDDISAPPHVRNVEPKTAAMRIRFAMRFGDEQEDEESSRLPGDTNTATRKERVRAAFNSPFWPFVLTTTSVGQEGLDFHHYCHAITHWNLPANPVDLEQREGRINRYKGHAIRKNVAAFVSSQALKQAGDVWDNAFKGARDSCLTGQSELIPYWLFPGNAKIERHVPRLPFSREVDRLDKLRKALAIYRMVFGQSRQEDLIAYLITEIPDADREAVGRELLVDLSPSVCV